MTPQELVRQYARAAGRASTRTLSRRLRGGRGVYDGTATNRQTADWNPGSYEPPALTAAWLSLLRQRSRSLARTAPHVVSAFSAIRDNVIGPEGFRLRPRPRRGADPDATDDALARQLAQLWADHSAAIDIDRRESFASVCRTGLLEYPEAGEVFFLETIPPPDDAGVVPQALELVFAERCDHSLSSSSFASAPKVTSGHTIRNGIEFDRYGRRYAYHFGKLDALGTLTHETTPVRAARCHHLMHRVRAGQERGLPWLYPATVLAHDLDDLIDSELTSAQVAACLAAFVETEGGAGIFGQNTDPDGVERDEDDDRPVIGFDPGMVAYLQPGEKVSTIDPQRPGGNFEPFAAFLVRMLGKSLGPAYETISGDYRRTNFASGRLAHLVERRFYRRVQADTRDLVARPVYSNFVRAAVFSGRIPVSPQAYLADPRRYDRVDIQGPGWEHHDPLKEVTAAAIRILTNLSTLDEECSALGRDHRAVLEQRTREVEDMTSRGLPLFAVGGLSPVNGQASANSTKRLSQLHKAAKAVGYEDAFELATYLEDGAAEIIRRNGRLQSMNGAHE